MLENTEGIVLHFVRYGENSVIAQIYTKTFGRQSFLINAVRSKKSKNRATVLQPLFLVDLVCYQKESREVQRIKEIINNPPYQSIPFNVLKTTQALFIAEMLLKTLREQESSPVLFNFIKNALCYFDLMEEHAVNFHLWFLLRLTEYLGFLPDIRGFTRPGWFDMQKGTLVSREPAHPYFANREETRAFVMLGGLKMDELDSLNLSRSLRARLTAKLADYYQLHFQHLGELKSLKVLQEVFKPGKGD